MLAEKTRLMKKFRNMAPGIRNGEVVGTNKILNIGPEEHHAAMCGPNQGQQDAPMGSLNEPASNGRAIISQTSNMVTPSATNRRASIGFNDGSRNEPNDFHGLRPNP